eukprot:COSAG02_NODE_36382_length_455_cov_0.887640_1_plen_38_part_10
MFNSVGKHDHNWEGFKRNRTALENLGINHEWNATTGKY